jgi:ubiquinone/menaquinone biosynthesis C-methylase UbiE
MFAISEQLRIKRTRWQKAQEYERGFWQRLGDSIKVGTTGPLDWYRWRAARLEQHLARVPGSRSATGKVLEIGSGPIGTVNFLEWGERYAIDPLEAFYRQQPALVKLRNPGTTYLSGSGEHLPLPDASCALVIIDNVIDHTYEPEKILQEISRVLEPSGRLYLSVNVHTRWGAFLHNLLAVLRIDKGHPYTFTSPALRRVLQRGGFNALLEEIGDYRVAKQTDRRSDRLTDRIKGYTGLSEFQHLVLCSRAFTAAQHAAVD